MRIATYHYFPRSNKALLYHKLMAYSLSAFKKTYFLFSGKMAHHRMKKTYLFIGTRYGMIKNKNEPRWIPYFILSIFEKCLYGPRGRAIMSHSHIYVHDSKVPRPHVLTAMRRYNFFNNSSPFGHIYASTFTATITYLFLTKR